jgi:hypothetical protein
LLFAPAAGYRRREDGYLGGIGTNGGYWSSSTLGSTDPSRAGNWNFSADNVNPLGGDARTTGRPVRCVQASARRLFRGAVGEGGDVKAPCNRFSAFCDAGAGNPVCCRAENGRIFGAKNT